MWSCQYETGHPVELVFELPFDGAAKAESHGLSKICVWNYNRGIKVGWCLVAEYIIKTSRGNTREMFHIVYSYFELWA